MPTPLTLISSMATRQLLADLLPAYERATGQAVRAESVGGVDAARRVQAGETFDAVLLASAAIEQLMAAGHVVAGSRVDIVRSGIAVAVREGAPVPDIGSVDALRAALLSARSLSFSTGPSGVHLMQLFERWGIAQTLQPRIVQAPVGVPVGSLVADGRAELGFQQLSELLGVPGIRIVGPLPEGAQSMTTFSGAVCSTSGRVEAVRDCLSWLAAPATADAKRRQGMEPA
jgi:molybdate transport system substrate-binding protein